MTNRAIRERLNPYFIEYYNERRGELDITDEAYEKGKTFKNGLGNTHEALRELGAFGVKYFEGHIRNGVIVIEPEFPIERTTEKEGSSYEWMVTPETSQSTALMVIDFLIIASDDDSTEALVAHGVSPAYRRYRGMPSLQEQYKFNPLDHTIAILEGRHEPDARLGNLS